MLTSRTFMRITGAAALAILVAGCDEPKTAAAPPQQAARPVEVAVVTVQPQRLTITSELPGRTAAYRVAEVRPQVGGIILKRLFEEGRDVKAGQQLYQIDPAPYQAALETAKAELAKAQAAAKASRAKAARYKILVADNAVSRQDYDDIVATVEQNDAQIAAAQAAVQTARINLDYTKVFAPISGRIGKSAFTEGALVTANQAEALATVTQLDPIYVDVTQSSAQLMQLRRQIAEGKLQGADAAQAPVTLALEDGGLPYDQPGRLQFSDVTVDQSTGAVRLRAVFPNPRQDLLPGLFVRAQVSQGVKDDAFLVPQQGVVRTPDGSAAVWVVAGDGKVAMRPVKTAQAMGDKWLVTEGLQAGDQVVVEGLQKIRPGATVQPVPAKSAGEGAATSPRQPS